MPTTRRSRTVQAPPDAVWAVVGDPSHQARWWPKVSRVESVQEAAFTRVYMTAKGRPVRADFRVEEVDPPRSRRWVQVLEGTPFERFLRSAEERATIEPAGEGASVTLDPSPEGSTSASSSVERRKRSNGVPSSACTQRLSRGGSISSMRKSARTGRPFAVV